MVMHLLVPRCRLYTLRLQSILCVTLFAISSVKVKVMNGGILDISNLNKL